MYGWACCFFLPSPSSLLTHHPKHHVSVLWLQVNVPLNMLDPTGYSVSTLMQLQAGGVVGCSTCPDRHVLLTAAGHGTISAIDYR
jgi:hypothetical protein